MNELDNIDWPTLDKYATELSTIKWPALDSYTIKQLNSMSLQYVQIAKIAELYAILKNNCGKNPSGDCVYNASLLAMLIDAINRLKRSMNKSTLQAQSQPASSSKKALQPIDNCDELLKNLKVDFQVVPIPDDGNGLFTFISKAMGLSSQMEVRRKFASVFSQVDLDKLKEKDPLTWFEKRNIKTREDYVNKIILQDKVRLTDLIVGRLFRKAYPDTGIILFRTSDTCKMVCPFIYKSKRVYIFGRYKANGHVDLYKINGKFQLPCKDIPRSLVDYISTTCEHGFKGSPPRPSAPPAPKPTAQGLPPPRPSGPPVPKSIVQATLLPSPRAAVSSAPARRSSSAPMPVSAPAKLESKAFNILKQLSASDKVQWANFSKCAIEDLNAMAREFVNQKRDAIYTTLLNKCTKNKTKEQCIYDVNVLTNLIVALNAMNNSKPVEIELTADVLDKFPAPLREKIKATSNGPVFSLTNHLKKMKKAILRDKAGIFESKNMDPKLLKTRVTELEDDIREYNKEFAKSLNMIKDKSPETLKTFEAFNAHLVVLQKIIRQYDSVLNNAVNINVVSKLLDKNPNDAATLQNGADVFADLIRINASLPPNFRILDHVDKTHLYKLYDNPKFMANKTVQKTIRDFNIKPQRR